MSSGVASCGVIVVVREEQSLAPDQEGPQEWPVLHLLREYKGSVPLRFWYFCFLQQSSAQNGWWIPNCSLSRRPNRVLCWCGAATFQFKFTLEKIPQAFISTLCSLVLRAFISVLCFETTRILSSLFFLPLTFASKPYNNSNFTESPWKNHYSSSFP